MQTQFNQLVGFVCPGRLNNMKATYLCRKVQMLNASKLIWANRMILTSRDWPMPYVAVMQWSFYWIFYRSTFCQPYATFSSLSRRLITREQLELICRSIFEKHGAWKTWWRFIYHGRWSIVDAADILSSDAVVWKGKQSSNKTHDLFYIVKS